MKQIIKLYKQGKLISYSPHIKVSPDEIREETNDPNLIDLIHLKKEYQDFCESQTKTGQSRKNEKNNRRKKLFKNIDRQTEDKYLKLYKKIYYNKLNKLPFYNIEIEFDGRKRKNFPHFIKAIETDINIGGISPQIYGLGFKKYKILNNNK